jgi:autotransporter-associated beta strand protein
VVSVLGTDSGVRANLTIVPTWDSTITGDANAATIEASINETLGRVEADIANNVTVHILFKETTTGLGASGSYTTSIPYATYLNDLKTLQTISNDDSVGMATLPTSTSPISGSASGSVVVTDPLDRALGGSATPSEDSTIYLNTSIMNISRTGTQNGGKYDIEAVTAHEVDEVLGIGGDATQAGGTNGNIGPLDPYRYASAGVRSFTNSNTSSSYFSIDNGKTRLVGFNQNTGADLGDWVSGTSPVQVQDAYGSPGKQLNISGNELAGLDVAGWTLTAAGLAAETQVFTGSIFTWNPSASISAPVDGSGTWNSSSSTPAAWYASGVNFAWNTSAIAVIGAGNGAAGSITVVSGGITAGGLVFNAAGSGTYTVAGGAINLSQSTLVANTSATISSALVTPGLNLSGSGVGNFISVSGQINLGGSSNAVSVSNATLSLNEPGNPAIPQLYFNSSGGIGTVNINSGGQLLVNGSNDLTGINNYAVTVVVNTGGILNVSNGATCHLMALVLNGGTVASNGSFSGYGSYAFQSTVNVTANSTISALNMAGSPTFNVASGAVLSIPGNFNGGANASTNNLTLSSAVGGTVLLTGNNSVDLGSVTINSGILTVGNGGTLPTGAVANNAWLIFNQTSGTLTVPDNISGTGTLIQQGAGSNVTLSGVNTYTGNTAVMAGTLQANSPTSIGGTSASVRLFPGATIAGGYAIDQAFLGRISNTITSGVIALAASDSNNLNFSSANLSNASLGATGGTQIYTGTLTPYGSSYRLGGGGGTLIFSSVLSGASNTLQINPNVASSTTVSLTNTGNSIGGTVTVNSGTLKLDYTGTNTGAAILNNNALNMGGGTLSLLGTDVSGQSTSQSFASLALTAGSNFIVNAAPGSGSSNLSLGTITRSNYTTVDFTVPVNGTITTKTANSNGIIGGYATVDGSTWAVSAGTGAAAGPISGLPASSYTTTATAGTTASNYSNANIDVTTSVTPTAAIAPNSLRFNTAAVSTLTLTGANTISSGGILVTANVGNNLTTITGGTITANGNGNNDVIITNNDTQSQLSISSPINTKVTKSGPGKVVLTGGVYGPYFCNGGILDISGAGTLNYSAAVANNGGTIIVGPLDNEVYVDLQANSGGTIVDNSTTFSNTLNFDGGTMTGSGFWNNQTQNGGVWTTGAGTSSVLSIATVYPNAIIPVNTGPGSALTITSNLYLNAGLNVYGSGMVILAGPNTFVGAFNIGGSSIVQVGSVQNPGSGALGNTSAGGIINLIGGTLQYSPLNNYDYSSRFSTAAGQIYNIDTNSQNVTFATPLTSTGGTLNKLGLGTLSIDGANTATNVLAGTLQLNSPAAITSTSVKVYPGAAFTALAGSTIAAGTNLLDNGTVNLNNTNPVIATLNGSGTLNVNSTSLTVTNGGSFTGNITGGSLNVSGGTLYLSTGVSSYTSGTIVSGGQLVLASPGSFPLATTLTIAPGATVQVANHGSSPTLVPVVSLLSNSGTIDLVNNAMVLQNSSGSISLISAQVTAAYFGGGWNGTGNVITSSTAAADSTHLTAIGIGVGPGNFEGLNVGSGDVLLKYTYYGDATLDGQVDSSDYARIDSGYLSNGTLTGWYNGDFNYDGAVNGSDYTLIDNTFNQQVASLAAAVATQTTEIDSVTSVPEPAGLTSLLTGALLLRRRRRTPLP